MGMVCPMPSWPDGVGVVVGADVMGIVCPMFSWPGATGADEGGIGMVCPIASWPVVADGLMACPLWLAMS